MEHLKRFKFYYLFLVVLCLFSPSLFSPPLWDDYVFIFENAGINNGPHPFVFWSRHSGYTKAWPLGYSTFWGLVKIFGKNYFLYKLLSITIHFFNGILIFKILSKFKIRGALFVSCLFLIHPLHVETVSWIFQLNNIIATSFFLLSVYTFGLWTERKKYYHFLFTVILYFLSLFTKPLAVAMIPIYFYIHYKKEKKLRVATLVCIPFLLLSILITKESNRGISLSASEMVISETFHNSKRKSYVDRQVRSAISMEKTNYNILPDYTKQLLNSYDHVVNMARNYPKDNFVKKNAIMSHNFFFYVVKFFIPSKQLLFYPLPNLNHIYAIFSSSSFVFFLCILAFSFWRKNKFFPQLSENKEWLVLYILAYLPFSGLFYVPFMKYSLTSDHWSYLMCIPLAVYFTRTLEHYLSQKRMRKIGIIILLIFGFRTFYYSFQFNNQMAMLTNNARENPQSDVIRYYLSFLHMKNGNKKEAIIQIKEAAKLMPNNQTYRKVLFILRKMK